MSTGTKQRRRSKPRRPVAGEWPPIGSSVSDRFDMVRFGELTGWIDGAALVIRERREATGWKARGRGGNPQTDPDGLSSRNDPCVFVVPVSRLKVEFLPDGTEP